MKKSILITCLYAVTFAAIDVFAQNTAAETYFNFQSITGGTSMFRTYDNRFTGIKGSPKILEQYVPGRIIFKSGMKVKHDKVNFDSYNGDLVVIQSGIESVVNTALISYFVLEPTPDDTLRFEKLPDIDGKIRFFQQLYNGKRISLVKKHSQELIQPNNTGAYNAGRDYAELVPEHAYFLFVSGELKGFKNKKTFLQLVPNQEEQAETFIKKEKIDFKSDESVRRLVEFLNSLSI